jgi:hypothetical protein
MNPVTLKKIINELFCTLASLVSPKEESIKGYSFT